MAKRGYTTKDDVNRGLGLSNLKDLVYSIEGASLQTEVTDDKFAQVIVMMKDKEGDEVSC